MLNPITYTEHVVRDFLRYQLTTYPFADVRLHRQMRNLLNLEESRRTPLLKGPYVSLSRSFRQGPPIAQLAAEGLLHPHLPHLAPYDRVYGHQERAIRAIAAGRTTLISTGTGSGKTEAFLYPIISRCLTLRDESAPEGIIAVIVYPMNALAEDQLERMRALLAGSGVSFGLYIGKTPKSSAEVPGIRLQPGASRADYEAELRRLEETRETRAVHPTEERPSREELRAHPPRILLTNVKQLEYLLTRQKDIEMFRGSRLEYLVFDEAHTFRGAAGAETACLIRRLRSFCGRGTNDTVCVGASATIAGSEGADAEAARFASRFFGVPVDSVDVVREEFEPDFWSANRRVSRPFPASRFEELLNRLSELENGSQPARLRLSGLLEQVNGTRLETHRIEESLYEQLSANELLYQASEILQIPQALETLCRELGSRVGRSVTTEEVLAWFALGAVARKNGRALLRPVIHGFVKGVGGAVVTFPGPANEPRLWLTAEDYLEHGEPGYFTLPVTTCTTCGQQYFIHSLADFDFTDRAPFGGEAVGTRRIWRPLSEARGGRRAVLVDRLVTRDEDDEDDSTGPPRNTAEVFLCRHCGAVHPTRVDRCDACGTDSPLVLLYVVRQRQETIGRLHSCISCRTPGRRMASGYREPARPVKAVNVSDVFVLAQSMIQHADHKRLLIFADNRQEAAFQAGWMQDHARRYRLRSLMYRRIVQGPVSVGDLAHWLDNHLAQSPDESRALAPEVWRFARPEAAGNVHADQRHYFLRIQVFRELTMGHTQRIGLEPWGRMVVEYLGLDSNLPFFADWAGRLNTSPGELRDGVANLLDVARRAQILLDRERGIFSRYWREGDAEISRGYLPFYDQPPAGLKLTAGAADRFVKQWYSRRGQTAAMHAARRWGVKDPEMPAFFEALWSLLTNELRLLAPANLVGASGRPLPGSAGAMQIDADFIRMHAHEGVWRCSVCRRRYLRPNPQGACMVNRCAGVLEFEREDEDNYDLQLLTDGIEMVKPREHSAQIPAEDREYLEREFKSDRRRINTLVATPTLELGVDIGPLDSVLMRNVPPLPANYWQRSGRAGRRQRMAVNLTYARPASHDRAYFAEPLKMLAGEIDPPGFNLRNDVMVRKHLHATAITALHRLAAAANAANRARIIHAIEATLPVTISEYLFDAAGEIRRIPFDVSPLTAIITENRTALLEHVESAFAQEWPVEDADVVRSEVLASYLDDMPLQLLAVVDRLRKRLRWATDQMTRLEEDRRRRGALDREDAVLYERCEKLIKRLKGESVRRNRDAEGVDDTYTFGVLAAEGFLPGYGLDTGYVTGYYQVPPRMFDLRDWQLHRSQSMALREYVPGNLIYANGQKFLARYFHLEPEPPVNFQVDLANEAVCEAAQGGGAMAAVTLPAVPICDVDLPHQSHISDDEDYRFQMPVAIYGYEQQFHGGGRSYHWGPKTVQFRRSVRLRLVNVGPAQMLRAQGALGYPVCTVCGQSRSPLASTTDLNEFMTNHQDRCRRRVEQIGFYADVQADALSIVGCADREEAHSVAEAIREGAVQILDMEREDLQPLAIGRQGDPATDILLYDPMPGGSGLLDQIVRRWTEVVDAARQVVSDCPSNCQDSCIDCLQTFRNAYYHRHLNRHTALDRLDSWGRDLTFSNDVPPRLPSQTSDQVGSNEAEETLRGMLDRAGLHGYETSKRIPLGPPLGDTLPDFFYDDPEGYHPGICIYLDGMSEKLHGSPETAARDRRMREQLRATGYQVIEIPYGHLTDREQMRRHFYAIGRILLDRDTARNLRDNPSWFDLPDTSGSRNEWDDILTLLDSEWHSLANALRQGGIAAPSDVDWDIPVNGRVSGERAIMVWESDSGPLLLVQRPAPDSFRYVIATEDVGQTVTEVQRMLDETR